jgi:hypothetical protein
MVEDSMTKLQRQIDLNGKEHFIFTGERKKPKEYPQETKKTGLAKYQGDDKNDEI